ncbi:MAG: hypothetical protein U9O87_02120 [Verrucomicrobiota bacterium]|nr:hypothetical protein [Verrucomicrobiota bacterium]
MIGLNKALNVLTFLLAITALVFSILLFNQRNELRDRADKMAETMTDMASRLDEKSGTDVGEEMVTFKKGDPTQKIKDSGSLSWVKYHDSRDPITKSFESWNKYLDAAKEQVDEIMSQRDFLASNIIAMGKEFEMEEVNLPLPAIQNVDTNSYEKVSEKILITAKELRKRDQAMINNFEEFGKIIEHRITAGILKERTLTTNDTGEDVKGEYKYDEPLKNLRTNIGNLKQRTDTYVSTMKQAITNVPKFNWETDFTMIGDELEYTTAMTALENDMTGINEKLIELEKTKIELEETNIKLDETIDQLEISREELNKAEDEIADQKVVIEVLTKKINRLTEKFGGQELADVDKNVEGDIILVNPAWDFAIINLGEKNVQENWELLIKRNDKFIGKMVISKVMKNVAVGEIMHDLKQYSPMVGDTVIFP